MKDQADILKTLGQFGFEKLGESGNQTYGVCPFCGESKFYVNEAEHLWDCKKCLREGGFYDFLTMMTAHCEKAFLSSGRGKELAEERGISMKTLRRNHVGYNPINDTYIIPNYFFDNPEKVYNILIHTGKRLMATAGCKLGLLGWENITDETKNVWLCEGGWDWLVMDEILHTMGKKKDRALGCPGAGTFKGEWGRFFDGKDTAVVYDNDDAGKLGLFKVRNNLIHYAKGLKFAWWPKKPDGYDLRDFFNESKRSALKTLMGLRLLLRADPPEVTTAKGKLLKIAKSMKTEYKGKGVSYEEVYKAYRKWLHLPSTDIIDILFGVLIANRLDGDPIWMFLVAPSGGTKTEMLLSVAEAPDIEVISSLTPKTLVSGMTLEGGFDPSLLPKLDGKILIIKDFTAILSMNKVHRDEILGDLRDAYDGEFSKPFGNAQWRKYKSKFGIVAGVTPVIEGYLTDNIAMGERFLRFSIPIEGSIEGRKGFIRRALTNVNVETSMRESLRKIATKVLECDYGKMAEVPEKMMEKIVCLAQWVCMVRGTVNRDRYTKQVTTSPYIEVGTRIAKQLCKIGIGVAMFKGKKRVGEDEYRTVLHVARSSVFRDYEMLFGYLYRHKNKEYATSELAEGLGLPTQLIDRIAQDLKLTGVLNKKRVSALGSKWSLKEGIVELVEESGVYG